MHRSIWGRWIKSRDGSRRGRKAKPPVQRLGVTRLESRDVPTGFAPGDLVVYRVGDGTTALSGTVGAAVFLDEYSTSGALIQSLNVGTLGAGNGGAANFVAGATATTEGNISLSADGTHLIFTGFNTPVGTATTAAVTPVNRVIGTVTAGATVNTVVQLTGASQGSTDLRGAASVSGNGTDAYYITTNSTVSYVASPGPAATSTSILALNSRAVEVVGSGTYNTLYASTASTGTAAKLSAIGALGTLPTATATPVTPGIVNLATGAGGNGFFFAKLNSADTFSGPDTAYLIDSLNALLYKATTTDGVNWTSDGSIAVPGTATGDGLTGMVAGTTVNLYLTANNGAGLYAFSDASGFGGALTGTIGAAFATAATNEAFRGVAFAPTASIGTGTLNSFGLASDGTPAQVGANVTLTATLTAATTPTGTVAFKYNGTTIAVKPLVAGVAGTATAQYVTSTLPIGTDPITAVYNGDATYASATSSAFNQVINGTTTTTGLTSNFTSTQPNVGQTVTFTATITSNSGSVAPSGTVNFFDNGFALNTTPISLTAGAGLSSTAMVTVGTTATQTLQNLTPGSHSITAVYTPAIGYTGGNAAMIQNVKANPFGAGDILVFRDGDGTNALLVTGNTVYLDEFNTTGTNQTPIQSIVMPTTSATAVGAGGNQALITCSQQSTEGQLSLSADGQYVYLVGYDTAPGGSTGLTSTSATSVPRTIGRIKYDGTIDTSMALTDLASGGSVRGVYSPGGNSVYATGSTGGVRFVPSYSSSVTTSTLIDGGTTSLNQILAAGGKLYVSAGTAVTSGTTTVKVAQVGTGLPTTSGQTLTTLSGIPTGNSVPIAPQGFFFTTLNGPSVGPDTLYIADNGVNFANGNITKWSLSGGTWTETDIINVNGLSTNPSFCELNGAVSGGTVNLYATFGGGGTFTGPGYLYSITDSGGYNSIIPSHGLTVLASVGPTSNETFRGVAPVPTGPAQPTVSNVQINDGSAQRSEVRSIQVTFSSPVTFAGGNSNAAAAFQLQHVQDTTNIANLQAAVSAGNTVVTLTFTTTGNAATEIDPVSAMNGFTNNASLADGNYQLTIFAADVSSAATGLALAGGGVNGNYVASQSAFVAGGLNLYRIFGDATGNGFVDALDLGQFRSTYNLSSTNPSFLAYLDADNSLFIDSQDLGQFRTRYNVSAFS